MNETIIEKQQWPREVAMRVAQDLMEKLRSACDRILVAGSLRRGKPAVGDIELLCISKLEATAADLFGVFTTIFNAMDERVRVLIEKGFVAPRPNKRGVFAVGEQNKLLIHTQSGIPVDIFATTPNYWGMALMVRTGPKDFNIKAMVRFRERGMRGHAYRGVSERGKMQDCPDEETVFAFLGWPFVPPEKRDGWYIGKVLA